MPGILSGVILAMGRIVGETAALIYTAGTVARCAEFPHERRTHPGSAYVCIALQRGLYTDEAYATAVVLLVLVFIINAVSAPMWQTKLSEQVNEYE